MMKQMGHGISHAGHKGADALREKARAEKAKAEKEAKEVKEKEKKAKAKAKAELLKIHGIGKIPASLKPLPLPKIPASLVGNKKCGHGGFCHANKIKDKEGARKGGEGLRRVGKQ